MGYSTWFFYDKAGFLIVYSGAVRYKPLYHMCPTFRNNGDLYILQIYTQDPTSSMPLEALTPRQTQEKAGALSIEKAAGLSIQRFYDLLLMKDTPVCFDTPRDIWK